jgi:hypothetical protein
MSDNEKANYVTCLKGHKIFVIWSPKRKCFGFTCDQCDKHSARAVSEHGVIEIKVVRPA